MAPTTPARTPVIADQTPRYHGLVRQLLLRIPPRLHERLASRAAAEGRSINSLATEILDGALGGRPASRTARLRAKAAAMVMLDSPSTGPDMDPTARAKIIAATAGIGPVLDQILAEERER